MCCRLFGCENTNETAPIARVNPAAASYHAMDDKPALNFTVIIDACLKPISMSLGVETDSWAQGVVNAIVYHPELREYLVLKEGITITSLDGAHYARVSNLVNATKGHIGELADALLEKEEFKAYLRKKPAEREAVSSCCCC